MLRSVPWLSRSSFCALLALSGCSDDDSRDLFRPGPPLPECPNADYSTCDVRDGACQQRLLELAACVRGGEPPSDLQVDVLNEAEYAKLLREEAGDTPEPKAQHFNRALSLFGLAPLSGVPVDDQIEEQATHVAGQYLWEDRRIVIVDHGLPASSSDVNGVLLHEFVHALQDADHDLMTWPGPDVTWTFDSSLAASTVFEGEASFYETRVAAPLLGLDHERVDFEGAFQNFMDRALVRAFDSSLRLTQSYRTVPYGIGALQAFHAWEGNGPSGLDPLWSNPPLTMQRVLAETFGRNTPQESAVEIPAPEVPEGLTLHGEDSLGAWGLCLVLTSREGVPSRVTQFVDQALTWRGDRFSVYTDDEASTYALWQLELESTKAAEAMDDFFDVLDVDHATAGKRVFVSYNPNDLPASAALTAWGESWLASGGD
ncbi:MAG: hypothetical protein K0R38_2603 [Polyangiaceae bacterium]|nr:hypothetical protein [Polyangiaceae bacterium]